MLLPCDTENQSPIWRTFSRADKRFRATELWRRAFLTPLLFNLRADAVFAFLVTPCCYVVNTSSSWIRHVLKTKRSDGTLDDVAKLVLIFLMGKLFSVFLFAVTVMFWCDCKCTLCLGISVCFLFASDFLLKPLCLCMSLQPENTRNRCYRPRTRQTLPTARARTAVVTSGDSDSKPRRQLLNTSLS